MPHSAWICVFLGYVVGLCFSGIVAQCTANTRPKIVKTLGNRTIGIVAFQRTKSVCEWRITADEGYLIRVTVRDVSAGDGMPCNLTDLTFYDGGSSRSPAIQGVCVNGDLAVTSRGQEMLVQLPPAPLTEKNITQRFALFSHRAYPCDSIFVFFRRCKTSPGTTQRRRDTTTSASRQFTTTTTTTTTTTNNNNNKNNNNNNNNNNNSYERSGSVVVSPLFAGLFTVVFVIFVSVLIVCCGLKRAASRPRLHRAPPQPNFTLPRPSTISQSNTPNSILSRPNAAAETDNIYVSRSSSSFQSVVTIPVLGNSHLSSGGIPLQPMARNQGSNSNSDVHSGRPGHQSAGGDGIGGGRRLGDLSGVWWAGAWWAGAHDNEGASLQMGDAAPPPPYSSLSIEEVEVHDVARDDPAPPPYTEAMKTAFPPADH